MYSAKDIEELNAINIEYPDGSMHTLYEAEQQQRAFERKIRATKRTLAACDEALNNLSDEEILQKLEKNFQSKTFTPPCVSSRLLWAVFFVCRVIHSLAVEK